MVLNEGEDWMAWDTQRSLVMSSFPQANCSPNLHPEHLG